MADEVIKVIMEVLGEQKVKELTKSVVEEKQKILDLNTALNAGSITQAQYTADVERVAVGLAKMNKELDVGKNKLAGFGQAGLQSGRVIQDFTQGGIAGILNNIEGMSQALGGGPGLAGVLTILGVAAFVAKPFIMDLWKSFTGGDVNLAKDILTEIKDKIKDLQSRPIKIGVDQIELDRLETKLKDLIAGKAEFDRIMSHQTDREQSSGKQIAEHLSTPEGKKAVGAAFNAAGQVEIQKDPGVHLAEAKVAGTKQEVAEHRKAMIAAGNIGEEAEDSDSMMIGLKNELAQNQATALAARKKAADTGRKKFQEDLAKSRTGTGDEQVQAQARIAAAMRAGGRADIASHVEQLGPNAPGFMTQAEVDKEEKKAESARNLADHLRAEEEKKAKEKAAAEKEADAWQKKLDKDKEDTNDKNMKLAEKRDKDEQRKRDHERNKERQEFEAEDRKVASAFLAGPMVFEGQRMTGEASVKRRLLEARGSGFDEEQSKQLAITELKNYMLASGQGRPEEAGTAAAMAVAKVMPEFEAQFGANMNKETAANTKETAKLSDRMEKTTRALEKGLRLILR